MYSEREPGEWEGLDIKRCPHCHVSRPSLKILHGSLCVTPSGSQLGQHVEERAWGMYECHKCGEVVLAKVVKFEYHEGIVFGGQLEKTYPDSTRKVVVQEDIPNPAKETLNQAVNSIMVAPQGAVILASKAIDEMLKKEGFTSGSLFEQIEKATKANVLTKGMSDWAHEIRLDANEQRHPDIAVEPPQKEDAEKTVNFALVLAELLFVLPARVNKGRNLPAKVKKSRNTSKSPVKSPSN